MKDKERGEAEKPHEGTQNNNETTGNTSGDPATPSRGGGKDSGASDAAPGLAGDVTTEDTP